MSPFTLAQALSQHLTNDLDPLPGELGLQGLKYATIQIQVKSK